MDSNKKIKVSVVIRKVADHQQLEKSRTDSYNVLEDIKSLFGKLSDEEEKEDVTKLLRASKRSNEILADAFADVNREDLFNEKLDSIKIIDEIINQISNNI